MDRVNSFVQCAGDISAALKDVADLEPMFLATAEKEEALVALTRARSQLDALTARVLASADANCSPLGWPGVKGHTVNYLFEDLIPDLRRAGIDDATITTLFVDNPAGFLTIRR